MKWKGFTNFVDSVFGEDGEIIQTVFPHNKVIIVSGVNLKKEDFVLYGINVF